jgi:hypothetical protein
LGPAPGDQNGREAIYTLSMLPPMLLVHHLLPLTRCWYQALDGTGRLGRKKSQRMSERWANPHLGRSVLGLRHLNVQAQQAVRRQAQTFLDGLDYLDRS